MQELLKQSSGRLRRALSTKETESQLPKRETKTVESVDGIMQAVARLGTVAFAYWAVKQIKGAVKGAKGTFDDIADNWRNQGKAERDMKETLRREDEKDTAKIRKEISDDQVERERKKVKGRPKSIRGHWEGNVFIPNAETAKRPKASKTTEH